VNKMSVKTARGTYASFEITKDDKNLKKAIQFLQDKGESRMDGFMNQVLIEETEKVKELLKSKAGNLASVRTPAWGKYGASKNIYVKVADALKIHKYKKLEYAVHTGETIADAEIGVLGQRGGRIAHIISKGMNPFRYASKLPALVMSSTRWYKDTGARSWISTGMMMRRYHPGFHDTIDFIGLIQSKGIKSMLDNTPSNVIYPAALQAGFFIQDIAQSAGKGSLPKTKVGGTGIKSARG